MTELKRKELCSFAEAGRILGMHRNTVGYYVEQGMFSVVTFGKRPYIPREQVMNFLKPKELTAIKKQAVQAMEDAIESIKYSPPQDIQTKLGGIWLSLMKSGIYNLIEKAAESRQVSLS